MIKIKQSAQEQYRAERKRFEKKQQPKPVLADKLKKKREKEMANDGSEKVYMGDLL